MLAFPLSLVERLLALRPRYLHLCLYVAGATMALSMAPFFWFWLIPLTLGPAFIAWRDAPNAAASFWRLWSFTMGFFMAGLYWIGISVTADWQAFWWFLPVPVIGLPALLSFIQAGLTLPFWLISKNRLTTAAVAFIAAWFLVEWTKLWLFTGLPWNLLGYSLAFGPWMTQLAAVGGIWLLSLLVLFGSILPWSFYKASSEQGSLRLLTLASFGAGALAWGSLFAYSAWVLTKAPSYEALTENQPSVALIQPNRAQGVLQTEAQQRSVIDTMKHLTRAAYSLAESKGVRLGAAIWPEAAVPDFVALKPELRQYLAEVVPQGSYLITGAVRAHLSSNDRQPPDNEILYFNSLEILDSTGQIVAHYNKRHLVPFGEYVPLRSYIPWTNSLTGGMIDTTPGRPIRAIKLPSLPSFAPSICYEGIVPDYIIHKQNANADWMLNLTNDGWFGISSGPYQHFAIQRIRAIEERRSLVRVSNPGISGVFDAFGRNGDLIGLNTRSFSLQAIPKRPEMRNIFSLTGNFICLVLALTLLIVFSIFLFIDRIYAINRQG